MLLIPPVYIPWIVLSTVNLTSYLRGPVELQKSTTSVVPTREVLEYY